jgi:hypothetical protein
MLTVQRNRDVPAKVEPRTFGPGYVHPSGNYPPSPTFSENHSAFSELFEESVVNDEGSRHLWKTWEHYKRATVRIPAFYKETVYYNGNTAQPFVSVCDASPIVGNYSDFGASGVPTVGLDSWYSKRPDGGFINPPQDLDQLVSRALRSMMPQVKAELSLLNSLIELKDFKTLPRTIASVGKFVVKTGKTLRQLLRAGSDVYLQQQFNILPLLSDISGLSAALSRTEKRVNDLVSRQGRVQTRHFMAHLEPGSVRYDSSSIKSVSTSSRFVGLTESWGGQQRVRFDRTVVSDTTLFHAEVQYNYNYTEYQIAHAQLLGLLDALGVNLNPAIIWNALPWSFVVDWVVGVSQWLDRYKVSNMNPVVNILQFLWSVSRRRTIVISMKGLPSNPAHSYSQEQPVQSTVEVAYRRQVGMPTGSSIESSGLSPREFSLGAALVLSRKRRRSNRKN